MLIFPIVIGRLLTIPRDLVRAPFAVTTTSFEGLLTSNPNLFNRVLVMMLVAAPLSTMAVWALPSILILTLAAVVVSSSSLPTKFASLSPGSLFWNLLPALWNPALYLGDKCAACPIVRPLGRFCK